MATTLEAMRKRIAAHVGVSFTPELLDAWIQTGYRKVQAEGDWHWLRATIETELPRTGPLTNNYELTNAQSVLDITAHDGTRWPRQLEQLHYSAAITRWRDYETGSYSQTANYYTTIGNISTNGESSLLLRAWPPNPTPQTVAIRYLIAPNDWPTQTGSNTVEHTQSTPTNLVSLGQDATIEWALNEALQFEGRQDDARTKRAQYHQHIAEMKRRYINIDTNDLTLNAGQPQLTHQDRHRQQLGIY